MIKYFQFLTLLAITSLGTILAQSASEILDAYVLEALKVNPELLASRMEIKIAGQRPDQYSSLPDPVLTGTFAIQPIETRLGPQQARFRIIQPFPWFGTLGAKHDEYQSITEVKRLEYEDIRQKTILKIREKWLLLYLKSRQIKNFEKQLSIYKLLESRALEALAEDHFGFVETIRIRNEIIHLETKVKNLKEESAALLASFNVLLDRDPDSAVHLSDSLNIVASELPGLESVLDNNRGLLALRAKKTVYGHRLDYHRLDGYPRFGIGFDYAVIGDRDDVNIPDNGKDAYGAVLSISIPIFSSKYSAAVETAHLEDIRTDHEIMQKKNDLISAYRDLESEFKIVRRESENLRIQAKNTESALAVLEQSFGEGRELFDDIIRLRNSLYQIEYLQLEMETKELIFAFRIEQLAGFSYSEINGE